jgi:hypothetical protein
MIKGIVVYSPDDLQKAIDDRAWKQDSLVYRPQGEDVTSEFREVCTILFPPRFRLGGFAFVIDEAGELQTAHGISSDLVRIIKQHPTHPPRESVMIIQTNHRMAEFNNSCKALLDELYIFQTTLPGDLRTLEEHTGLVEITPLVRTLPKHHCIRYLYGRQVTGEQYEIWDNPQMWGGVPATTQESEEPNSKLYDDDEEDDTNYAGQQYSQQIQ